MPDNSFSHRQPETLIGGFTVDQFCSWLPCGRTKAYQLIRCGKLKARKVGNKTIITGPDAIACRDNLPCINEDAA